MKCLKDKDERTFMKRVLIISHNCLSKTGSNGRTLSNYLIGYPGDKLAQLYIHPEHPDFSVCQHFFCVSDKDVFRSILKRCPAGRPIEDRAEEMHTGKPTQGSGKKAPKNSLVFLLREFAWNHGWWNKKALLAWLDEFQPELILFQAGDAGFLFRLAVKTAERYNIPIVLYNTEGYYFKEKSYLPENPLTNLLYPLLHRYFCKEYQALMQRTALCIYNCDMLMDDYQRAFPHRGMVIMNTSEFADQNLPHRVQEHRIIYAGNVGVGRYESIIEVAQAAHKLDETLYVHVYASISDPEVRSKLEACDGVRLMGYVSYEELQKLLLESKFLLSVENFNAFYCEDLKYAFSTKIADSLASGNCLIVYAPKTIAVSQYLDGKQAAVLITDPEDLERALGEVLGDEGRRQELAAVGRKLALEHHSLSKNRELFQRCLKKVMSDESVTS